MGRKTNPNIKTYWLLVIYKDFIRKKLTSKKLTWRRKKFRLASMGESKLEGFVELYQESTHKFQESEKARVADVLEYQC